MTASFKQPSFDSDKLEKFSNAIVEAGVPVSVIWKKGKKELDNPAEANSFALKRNGKKVFGQTKQKGTVKLDKFPDQEGKIMLRLMKQYGFYSDPKWGLGIGLAVLFFILEFLFIASREIEWISLILTVGSLLILQFIGVAWLYLNRRIGKNLFTVSKYIGFAGYISTVLLSLLMIPLLNSFQKDYLNRKIETVED